MTNFEAQALAFITTKLPPERWGEAWTYVPACKRVYNPSRGSVGQLLGKTIHNRKLDAIRIAARGRVHFQELEDHPLDRVAPSSDKERHLDPLPQISGRAGDIVYWLAMGKTYSQISAITGIPDGSIKSTLNAVRRKYNGDGYRRQARSAFKRGMRAHTNRVEATRAFRTISKATPHPAAPFAGSEQP